MRRVCYVSGSRADFGLMESTLRRAHADPRLDLGVCVTGMHLSENFGSTGQEIGRSGLRLSGRVPVDLSAGDGSGMARALADERRGMVAVFEGERPDVVLVLGDRGEMLAGALAAIHLNIPVAHVHGGERSGTVDEPVRHAISKLSHYHFVATVGSRERLVRMGERAENVFVTGAPGIDGILDAPRLSRADLCADQQLDANRPIALVVYHPVLQSAEQAGQQVAIVLDEVMATGAQIVCLAPNSDAGSVAIREQIMARVAGLESGFRMVTHFERSLFLSWLAAVDIMVGNSSSGIIEAASFGLPVVNVGDRQFGRERNANIRDVPVDAARIREAIAASFTGGRCRVQNIYGDGRAGERIVGLLRTLPLGKDLLAKTNAY